MLMDFSMLFFIFVWGKVGGGGLGRSYGRSLIGGERERETGYRYQPSSRLRTAILVVFFIIDVGVCGGS